MKKDQHKTKVIFLINGNDLFAFFPKINYNNFSSLTKVCYLQIGQHSACVLEYAKESKKATKKEYNDLKKELESIGYNLELSRLK